MIDPRRLYSRLDELRQSAERLTEYPSIKSEVDQARGALWVIRMLEKWIDMETGNTVCNIHGHSEAEKG